MLVREKDNRAKNRNRSQIYAERKSDEGGRTCDKASKADTRERNRTKVMPIIKNIARFLPTLLIIKKYPKGICPKELLRLK